MASEMVGLINADGACVGLLVTVMGTQRMHGLKSRASKMEIASALCIRTTSYEFQTLRNDVSPY